MASKLQRGQRETGPFLGLGCTASTVVFVLFCLFIMLSPKYPDPSKVPIFEGVRALLYKLKLLQLEGPRILREDIYLDKFFAS